MATQVLTPDKAVGFCFQPPPRVGKEGGESGRAVVELAKDWRTDRALRHLEALLVVADKKATYLVSGNGDVIEPDDGIVAIGSGGPYALAAARALAKHTQLSARDIVQESMQLAGEICIFTNQEIVIEEL